jgi:hypothetical protein
MYSLALVLEMRSAEILRFAQDDMDLVDAWL